MNKRGSARTNLIIGLAIAAASVGGVIGTMQVVRVGDYIEFNTTLQDIPTGEKRAINVEVCDTTDSGVVCVGVPTGDSVDVYNYPSIAFPRGVPGLNLPIDSGDVVKITFEQTFHDPDTTVKDTVIGGEAQKDTVITKGARVSWTYNVRESGLNHVLKYAVRP